MAYYMYIVSRPNVIISHLHEKSYKTLYIKNTNVHVICTYKSKSMSILTQKSPLNYPLFILNEIMIVLYSPWDKSPILKPERACPLHFLSRVFVYPYKTLSTSVCVKLKVGTPTGGAIRFG